MSSQSCRCASADDSRRESFTLGKVECCLWESCLTPASHGTAVKCSCGQPFVLSLPLAEIEHSGLMLGWAR